MAQKDKTKGVWLVSYPNGDVSPATSEIAALREAMATNGSAEFVEYGNRLHGTETPDTTTTTTTSKSKSADTAENSGSDDGNTGF